MLYHIKIYTAYTDVCTKSIQIGNPLLDGRIINKNKFIPHRLVMGWYIKTDIDRDTLLQTVQNVTKYTVSVNRSKRCKHKPIDLDTALYQISRHMFTRPKQVTLKYQHYKELIPLKNGSKWYYKRNEFGDLEYYVNGVFCVLSTHKLELMVDDNGTAGLYKCIKTENKNIFSKEIIDR